MHFLPVLGSADCALALRQNYAEWGQGVPLEQYISGEESLRESAPRLLRRSGLFDDSGRLVASLERFSLRLWWPSLEGEREIAALGIGSVYTPPEARRRGYAARLLHEVLAAARAEGDEAALLFSDIDPEFYARLGFRAFPSENLRAPVSALPIAGKLSLRAATPDDLPRLLAWRRESLPRGTVRARLGPERWAFFTRKNSSPAPRLLCDGAEPLGYLCAAPHPKGLWVEELAAPGLGIARILATLRAEAEACRAGDLVGWAWPAAWSAGLSCVPRPRSVPMLADLCGTLHLSALAPALFHCWPSEHF